MVGVRGIRGNANTRHAPGNRKYKIYNYFCITTTNHDGSSRNASNGDDNKGMDNKDSKLRWYSAKQLLDGSRTYILLLYII
jgi:hypothetical protein